MDKKDSFNIEFTDNDIERVKIGSSYMKVSESSFIRFCIALFFELHKDNKDLPKIRKNNLNK